MNYNDPNGLKVNWSGNLASFAGIAGVGAGFFYFDLTSECKCNRTIRIKGFISTVALGAGLKFTGTKSPVSLYDYNECPEQYVANGGAAVAAIGAAAGGEGAGGLGYSFSKITIGDLFSNFSGGPSTGLDFSAAVYVGASVVTNFDVQQCCEK